MAQSGSIAKLKAKLKIYKKAEKQQIVPYFQVRKLIIIGFIQVAAFDI